MSLEDDTINRKFVYFGEQLKFNPFLDPENTILSVAASCENMRMT